MTDRLTVGGDAFKVAVEITATALDAELYDAYEKLLEHFGGMFRYEDSDARMDANTFEDCVTDFRTFRSHDVG